ncbi:flagellar basal body-associated protein FliL [Rugamonas sp. CCM 8940]|uniref:flagellar basal body-associated protein FliL n=1 Tax=Rugamonas sp. CCM 8940 TaxID=2765359 RepID=UPI0018F2FBDF|nr:flagellar basal body-associated protein FliL [Rugamonas sp. CCM 8940]MBJ7309178.1 flagellar basal body-associated protein FliL [Rugamonas sp. CCM 8940]
MKADAKADAAPAGGKKKLLIIIIAGVLVLLGGGGGAAWFFMHGKSGDEAPAKPKHKEVAKAGPPVFVPVEPFTVNLQPGEDGADQYLQLAFTLEVVGLEEVEVIKNNMPKVRSRMLLLLSGKRANEINTPEGKKRLSDEIVEQLRKPFEERGPQQDVSDVLYTSFIIQ